MISYIDALDGIVGVEPEPEVQPESGYPEPVPEASEAVKMLDPETPSDGQSEAQLQPEPQSDPQPEPESISVSEAEAITLSNIAPEPEPIVKSASSVAMLKPESRPEAELELQPDEVPGQILESAGKIRTHEPEAQPDPQSNVVPDEDSSVETILNSEISDLWSQHTQLSRNRKMTAKELRLLRAKLAERLYAMKQLLCGVGRAGQWRGWLRERKIPRSTADRLVLRHAEMLGSSNEENMLSGAISKSPKDSVEKIAKDVWRRSEKLLTTPESLLQFIDKFAEISGIAHEWRAEGLMIFNFAPEVPDVQHSTACVPVPNSPSSNHTFAVAKQTGGEPVTTVPATAQAARAGQIEGFVDVV